MYRLPEAARILAGVGAASTEAVVGAVVRIAAVEVVAAPMVAVEGAVAVIAKSHRAQLAFRR